MPAPIDPEHVLILGAGPGLSASVARRFGREGFRVTLLTRSETGLTEVAEELRADGITVDTVAGDAADPQHFRTTLEDIAATATPGVVIYNAARPAQAPGCPRRRRHHHRPDRPGHARLAGQPRGELLGAAHPGAQRLDPRDLPR